MLAALSSATAVVYPSRAEGFGLPVLEVLALATPIAASDLPVIRSWAGDACTYAAPGDIDLWTGALRRVAGGAHPPIEAGPDPARDYR